MALMSIKQSPSKTSFPLPVFLPDAISITAPPIPSLRPVILTKLTGSFKIYAAMNVIKMGVISIRKTA